MIILVLLALIFCSCRAGQHDEEYLLERVLANDIPAVSKLIGLDPARNEKQLDEDGQALKRRRLLPEHEPMDPSFDENLLLFEALQSKLGDMVTFLLSHARVRDTLDVFEFVQSAIEHQFNALAVEYLRLSDLSHFRWHFIKAFLFNNVDVLRVLSNEGDLGVVLPEALNELSLDHKCEKTILHVLDFCVVDKARLLDWACYNWSVPVMVRIFSDPALSIDMDHIRQSLMGGGLETAILMMAQPGTDIDAIKDELLMDEFDVVRIAERMKWCVGASPEQITEVENDATMYGAMLAVACFQYDSSKVKAILDLKGDLDGDMVHVLVSAMAARGQSAILGLLIQHNLTTLTASGLNDLFTASTENTVVQVIYAAFCQMDPGFDHLQSRIRQYDSTVDYDDAISWLTDHANLYRILGMDGLVRLIDRTKAHFVAMTAIEAEPTYPYLPPEVKDYILSLSFS